MGEADSDHTSWGFPGYRHPTKWVTAFDNASFQANEDPGLKLVIYTPVAAS